MEEPDWTNKECQTHDNIMLPFDTTKISKEQATCKELITMRIQQPDRFEKQHQRGNSPELWWVKTEGKGLLKIMEVQRRQIAEKYDGVLKHPSGARIYNIIHQHFVWPGMQKEINEFVKTCV